MDVSRNPWPDLWQAGDVLASAAAWAYGYELVREFKLSEQCRVDALLVPTTWSVVQSRGALWPQGCPSWGRIGLLAVEVKVTRADFQAGLRRRQYEDYTAVDGIMGLYVAAPRGVCAARELPPGVGLLVCSKRYEAGKPRHVAVCTRRPKYRQTQPAPEALWRLMYRLREVYEGRVRDERARLERAEDRFGERAGAMMGRLVRQIREEVSRDGPVQTL